MCVTMRPQRRFVELFPTRQDSADFVIAVGIGYGNGRRFDDAGELRQYEFDCLRTDLVAAEIEHGLLASGNDQKAVGIQRSQIPWIKPSVTKYPFQFFGVTRISIHCVFAAHSEATDLAWRQKRLGRSTISTATPGVTNPTARGTGAIS